MNEQRFVVSDVLWQRLEPHLPGKVSDAGATAKDNRLFLEAVFWRVRTGAPWREQPPAFGHWNSQFRRFLRWAQRGATAVTLPKANRKIQRDHDTEIYWRRHCLQRGRPHLSAICCGWTSGYAG